MRHKNLCVTRHFAWVVRTAWRCVTERGARTELRLAMLITSRGPKKISSSSLDITCEYPNTTKAEEGLQTSDFRLQTSDFRLQTSDFRLQTSDF